MSSLLWIPHTTLEHFRKKNASRIYEILRKIRESVPYRVLVLKNMPTDPKNWTTSNFNVKGIFLKKKLLFFSKILQ